MGSSWVGLGTEIPEEKQTVWLGKTYCLWVKDEPLVIWLTALGETIDEAADAPDWLRAMRAGWVELHHLAGSGVVHAGFDEYVTDDARRSVLYAHVVTTLRRLLEAGGDYHLAFASTPQCSAGFGREGSPQLGEKIGLIELGSNIARLLVGGFYAGEHAPNRWGHAPLDKWERWD